jgi:hypothetical protein
MLFKAKGFYTPIYKPDVLWYSAVRLFAPFRQDRD